MHTLVDSSGIAIAQRRRDNDVADDSSSSSSSSSNESTTQFLARIYESRYGPATTSMASVDSSSKPSTSSSATSFSFSSQEQLTEELKGELSEAVEWAQKAGERVKAFEEGLRQELNSKGKGGTARAELQVDYARGVTEVRKRLKSFRHPLPCVLSRLLTSFFFLQIRLAAHIYLS